MEGKRKTTTSTAVKAKYNAKTYDRIVVNVRKEIAEQYKTKCDELGISYSQPLHEAIETFLNND